MIGAQIAMTVGVLAAALSQGKLVGHEVDYIVGLGGTGAIATLLYLSIAFGKLTINTLNAYGSLMCLATVYSCGKQRVRVSQSVRLLVLAVIITWRPLSRLSGNTLSCRRLNPSCCSC